MAEVATRPADAVRAEETTSGPRRGRLWPGAQLLAYRLAFLATFLVVWWLLSAFALSDVLPSVPDTLSAVVDLLTGGEFYGDLGLTVRRVLAGFAIAYLAALVIGTLMGRSKRVEAFFEIFVVAGLSQPGMFIAMIILVALGLEESSGIVAMAFLALPIITVNFWQGTKNLDPSLDEMAQVFGYSRTQRVRHVILPQLLTPAITSVRSGFGICWKYVVVIELLGLPDGVGYEVNRAFQLFDLEAVIAWTLGFMLFVSAFEYVVLRPAERRLFAWRDRPTGALAGSETADPAEDSGRTGTPGRTGTVDRAEASAPPGDPAERAETAPRAERE